MFKLGFAFLFAVFFACNCYENSQAEDPAEKQDDVIAEGAGSPSDEYDDGFAENNDAVDNDDEPSRGESKEETAEERDDNGEFRDDSKKKG